MGAHASYPLIIFHLVSLKSQFQFITDVKYQGVIRELSGYEIYPHSDNDHLPHHVQIAEKLNLNQSKMNKILKDLLNMIIEGFDDRPLVVKEVVHILHVSPYIEPEDRKMDWVQDEWKKAIVIPAVLPVTPRIGDYVEIPFMRMSSGFSSDDKYYYGFVHDVRHSIRGTTQEIDVLIYPHRNIYYKWEKMKTEYEYEKRWQARLRVEK